MGVENSKSLLELATKSKEQEAINLLNSSYFIDPNYTNTDGDSALHLAASNNLIQLCAKLLSFNVDANLLNKYQSCPLHIATRMGHDQIVRLLLKSKLCNINLQSPQSSYTALTIAASCNNLSIARLLIEHKAIIQDITMVFASLHPNGDEMCRILLNHAADVNTTDSYGNTALMQSCALCHERVVNVLVSREWTPRIVIDQQNTFGWSALHFAYSASSSTKADEIAKANIINMLLKKGANMQLNNNDGEKPKDVVKHGLDWGNNISHEPPRKKRKIENDNHNRKSNRNEQLTDFEQNDEDPYQYEKQLHATRK
eukprot:938306_1